MKFNLKNRPWMTPAKANTRTLETLKEEIMDFERWFEGFEKEVREMLTKSETNTKKLLLKEKFILGSETFLQRSMEQAYRLAIEEVLGEQP